MYTLMRNFGWMFSGLLAAAPFIAPVDHVTDPVAAQREIPAPYQGIMKEGEIVEIVKRQLHIQDKDGKRHAFRVASHSMILLDGSFARLRDLRVGHYAAVIGQRVADHNVADQIDAVTQRHSGRGIVIADYGSSPVH